VPDAVFESGMMFGSSFEHQVSHKVSLKASANIFPNLLSMLSRPQLYQSDDAVEDALKPSDIVASLIEPCINNNFDRLRAMLTETKWATIALANPHRIYGISDVELAMNDEQKVYSRRTLNLAFLIDQVALHDHASIVPTVLAFGNEHDIPYDKLVQRSLIEAALRKESLYVFEKFILTVPDVVNQNLSLNESSLYLTESNNNGDLVEYLLQHGIDINKADICGKKSCNVFLLSLAARQNSIRLTEMLLKHDARLSFAVWRHPSCARMWFHRRAWNASKLWCRFQRAAEFREHLLWIQRAASLSIPTTLCCCQRWSCCCDVTVEAWSWSRFTESFWADVADLCVEQEAYEAREHYEAPLKWLSRCLQFETFVWERLATSRRLCEICLARPKIMKCHSHDTKISQTRNDL